MKYYGIKHRKFREFLTYQLAKIRYFCSQYTTFSKKVRDRRKANYNLYFRNPYHFKDGNLAIPAGKYCIPVCTITFDVVLRENIPQLKFGLKKLLQQNLSHKFLSGPQSLDKIFSCIETMDSSLSSGYSWIDVGRFDFEKDNLLKQYISYFDIYVRDINSSYLAIETHIYFTENFCKRQIDIINNDYQDMTGHVTPALMNNQKVSGSKQTHAICYYSDAQLKSDLIYENFSILKWQFYNRMQKFFPTIIHSQGLPPPSIYIYKTNISYAETEAKDFWASIGIQGLYGQFIDSSRKLFFRIGQGVKYNLHKKNSEAKDLVYLVNDVTMERRDGYYSADVQIVHEFGLEFSDPICKFLLLDVMNDAAADRLVDYKLKLNKVKLRKNKLHQLLRLRYFYERDIDFYKRYVHDDIWERPEKEIASIFSNQRPWHTYNYKRLTEAPVATKDKLMRQIDVISNEFDAKTSVLQHLSAYKNETTNRTINFAMLTFTATTLLLVIFPELADNISSFLICIWLFIKNIFA